MIQVRQFFWIVANINPIEVEETPKSMLNILHDLMGKLLNQFS
jgi:hypothetical protein